MFQHEFPKLWSYFKKIAEFGELPQILKSPQIGAKISVKFPIWRSARTQWAFGRLQRTNVPCPSKAYDRITDEQLKEHLGRRGRIQDQSKGPRSSPGELSPGENVRVQDHKTKHWFKRAKVVKKKNARTYLLRSGDRTFIRNIRFIKPDPNAEDSEHTSIAQEVQEENEGRWKVRGSNPTDDYRPYWIVQ